MRVHNVRRKFHSLHSLSILSCIVCVRLCVFAQPSALPKYETRAVWLTTLLGLDWPSSSFTNDPQMQQESLRKKIQRIEALNLNTVFFQVRSRGNAMYHSPFEPWASELTGTLGKNPGWDPLEFAIREAHALGLELHAWVNVNRVWTGDHDPSRTQPPHLVHSHRAWIKAHGKELWLDPGYPEARAYIAELCADIVKRYDVDGLHLDYCRYADADFEDSETYRLYGNGKTKAEWRRENINRTVEGIYNAVTSVNPAVKVGSAPIGIYENLPTAKGWQAYHSVYQDARRWLRDGYHDYIAPQIYWGLTNRGSKIDFEALAFDWKSHASSKHVFVGMAAYRPEVAKYLHEEIDVTRKIKSEGQCYFRFGFIDDDEIFRRRYDSKSLPAPMTWKDASKPPPPLALTVQSSANGSNVIRWNPPPDASTHGVSRIVLYRSSVAPVDINRAENILRVLPAEARKHMDAVNDTRLYYAATMLSRSGIESDAMQEGGVFVTKENASLAARGFTSVSENIPVEGSSIVLIGFSVAEYCHVRLRLMTENGQEIATVLDEKKEAGVYMIGIDEKTLAINVSTYIFEAGSYRVTREFLHIAPGNK